MLIDSSEAFSAALDDLNKQEGPIVLDTETTGLTMFARNNPARMCGLIMGPLNAADTSHDYYFTFRHAEGTNLNLEFMQLLRDFLAKREWVGFNLSFDTKILHCDGFALPSKCQDVMVAAHLANENEPSFALKKLAVEYLGKDAAMEDSALHAELKRRKLDKGGISQLPATMVAPYGLADVKLTRAMYWNRLEELKQWRLTGLFEEVNRFLLALIRTEIRGILLDPEEVHRQLASIGPKIEEYKTRLVRLAGREINVNSPVQLKSWLQLPSTAHASLQEELQKNPREDIQTLLDYRALTKAEGTYFRPFLEISDTDNRLHTSYKIHGTVTGRLSSSDPNLQQLPRNQKGRVYDVKACFTAPEGSFLLECDYSAIEPRIAAHYSNDPTMIGAFLQGKDFHTTVARSMFRKDQISKEERTSAKTLGLGVLYGMGAAKAAKNLGLRHATIAPGSSTYLPCYETVWTFSPEGDLMECNCSDISKEFCTYAGKAYIRKFYEGLPELEPFVKAVRSTAMRNGYIRNPFSGRCRRFEDNGSAHKSFNSLIQSTAAEILRRAFVELDNYFESKRAEGTAGVPNIVLTVHDSIVFEVPFSPLAHEHCSSIKRIMEGTTKLKVPVVIDAKIGYNLGNMGEVRL